MKERIDHLYGSIDNMLRLNNTSISRSYMYYIMNGYANITIKVALELKEMLFLDNLEDLVDMLDLEKR